MQAYRCVSAAPPTRPRHKPSTAGRRRRCRPPNLPSKRRRQARAGPSCGRPRRALPRIRGCAAPLAAHPSARRPATRPDRLRSAGRAAPAARRLPRPAPRTPPPRGAREDRARRRSVASPNRPPLRHCRTIARRVQRNSESVSGRPMLIMRWTPYWTLRPIWPAIRLRWICDVPAATVAARASRKCRCMSNSML